MSRLEVTILSPPWAGLSPSEGFLEFDPRKERPDLSLGGTEAHHNPEQQAGSWPYGLPEIASLQSLPEWAYAGVFQSLEADDENVRGASMRLSFYFSLWQGRNRTGRNSKNAIIAANAWQVEVRTYETKLWAF